ncbi:hypothetical protein WR25_11401 [Diploscapter pachys]|uniref:Uncharacterized protein n=1 Tax=Diploscapter pachys TaxID=2018661 RepID=A0A2A2L3B4_9BILA|nr:hypothetical protein WR25_11401 [Diploscapter pachys]
MISAESKFLANREDMISYREWTTSKIKICELYECWLRELLRMSIANDPLAQSTSLLMKADCYWFIAKMNRKAADCIYSNFAQAAVCLEEILRLCVDSLPTNNAFYLYVIEKHRKLIKDYRKALGESAFSGLTKHIPSTMSEYDIHKCRESVRISNYHINRTASDRISNHSFDSSSSSSMEKKTHRHSNVVRLSKLFANTAV